MIVRDELEWIEAAIESVRPFVAEINVYDTGSTDGTLELLEELAAGPGAPIRVKRGEWRRDFAWAREQSFAMASLEIDWILWLDGDDLAIGTQNVASFMADLDPHIECVRALFDDWRGPCFPIRIIRPGSGRWQNVVNEEWQPHTRRPAPIINPGTFCIYHADRQTDPSKYIALASEATADLERTPLAFLFLTKELWRAGAYGEALRAIQVFLSEGHDAVYAGTPWNWWRFWAFRLQESIYLALGLPELVRLADEKCRSYVNAWLAESDQGRAPDPRADMSDAETRDLLWRRYLQQRDARELEEELQEFVEVLGQDFEIARP